MSDDKEEEKRIDYKYVCNIQLEQFHQPSTSMSIKSKMSIPRLLSESVHIKCNLTSNVHRETLIETS